MISTREQAIRRIAGDEDSGGAAAFDEAALVKRLMGDRELARTIVAFFMDDCPRQLAALELHLKAGEVEAAGRRAHGLKGAAANVGSPGFEKAARAIEEAGEAGDLRAMAARFPELERRFQEARAAMRSIRQGRGDADKDLT